MTEVLLRVNSLRMVGGTQVHTPIVMVPLLNIGMETLLAAPLFTLMGKKDLKGLL
jgi:hypothetical protein